MSISEKLVTIAENQQKVYNAGASDFGLKGKGQGELVTLNNVHPIEHKVEVGLSSKNLFKDANTRIYIDPTKTYYITSDESTATRFAFYLYDENGNSLSSADDISISSLYWANGTRWYLASNSTKLNHKIEFKGTGASRIAYLEWQDMKYVNVQFEEGDTPTAYAPYIADFSDCNVKVSGKNLVNAKNPDVFPTGGRFEIIDDNTVRNYGCSGYGNATLGYYVYAPKGTKLTISFEHELGGEATGTWFIRRIGSGQGGGFKSGNTWTVGDEGYVYFEFQRSGGSGNNLLGWVDIKNVQVEVGSSSTEYEPYQETDYTPNAYGTVENVKSISPIMNISTDTSGVIISAECFKDAQKEIESLTTAIALTGGN